MAINSIKFKGGKSYLKKKLKHNRSKAGEAINNIHQLQNTIDLNKSKLSQKVNIGAFG